MATFIIVIAAAYVLVHALTEYCDYLHYKEMVEEKRKQYGLSDKRKN